MAWFQNVAIGIAVVVVAMACMVFGDSLQTRRQRQPHYDYCQNARPAEQGEVAAPQVGATADQKEPRKPSNDRYHELCNQWRAAEYAQESAHVAWIQLWLGVAGLMGLGLTVYFTGVAARGASDAAKTAEQALKVTERAYLAVKPHGVVPFEPDAHSDAHIGIENAGNLPARNVRWFIDAAIDPIGTRSTFPIRALVGGNVIPPGTDMHQSHRTSFTRAEWDSVRNSAAYLYVWGRVEYDDGFGGEPRHTLFCHRYDSRSFGRARQRPYGGLHALHLEGVRYQEHGNDAS